MLRNVLRPIRSARGRHESILRLLYDSRALGMLPSVISGHVPWTAASLRPGAMQVVLNDVLLGRRTAVAEFGSGVSTLYLGHVLAQQGGHLWSFEHDAEWCDTMGALLRRESLGDTVTLVQAPLEAGSWSVPWYSASVVDAAIAGVAIDHLLVDGPPSGSNGPVDARYPALPHLLDRMTSDSTVVLDDALRPGERAILGRWEAESDFRFKVRGISCDAAIGRRIAHLTL